MKGDGVIMELFNENTARLEAYNCLIEQKTKELECYQKKYNDEMLKQQMKEILKDIKEKGEYVMFIKIADEGESISILLEQIKMTQNEIKELENSKERYQCK